MLILKVDAIIKNANIFTSNQNNLKATAFAIKEGKFVYVGDEEGLSDFEGEIKDLNGKFIMPTIMDGHTHIPVCVSFQYAPKKTTIECNNKKECLEFISKHVKENPNKDRYVFKLHLKDLNEEKLLKEDLDKICSTSEITITEEEGHSIWVNSLVLENEGITDETEDITPGLSYYERDENGHMTGNLFEMTEVGIMMNHVHNITDDEIEESIKSFIAFAKDYGVSAVFEAGTPGSPEFHERTYNVLKKMDEKGELPIIIDGSYSVYEPKQLNGLMDVLKHYKEEFNTEHLKFNTLKIMLDGTLCIHTASMVEPYTDTNTIGGCLFDKDQIAKLLIELNENGFNLHVHTVAEGAVRTILDGVEIAKKELGENFNIKVTCAHIEIMSDADLNRFAELGVIANFTPWWHGGTCVSGGHKKAIELLGKERADKMYRSKTVYDTGAIVSFSSDNIIFHFDIWSPYLGMAVGMTRLILEEDVIEDENEPYYPSVSECMNIEEMIIGYTINNAKQLSIDEFKGSIEVGKDADYLIFNQNLLTTEPLELIHIKPEEVFFKGKRIN